MPSGKSRVARKATKGKGRVWKKGFSSSSNPQTTKFRDEAKNRFFVTDRAGQGNLTEAALAQHNSFHRCNSDISIDDNEDTQSIGAKTFDTFASSWSDCTNASFNRLFRNWQASSALHKEMLAVLAAVTEVIKSKGGKETETEYFATLMTTLETVDTVDATTAVVNLLGMVMKRLPPSVLKLKFSDVAKVFVSLLGTYMSSEHTLLLRGLLGCLSVLLRAQEAAVWSNSNTVHIYETLLTFIVHPKPKVRKAAQHAVCAILKASSMMLSPNPPPHHPAAVTTAKFCSEKIEQCGGSGAATTTLHILVLLKDILCCFPCGQLKTTCETVLRVMTLGNVLITLQSLQAFQGMFRSHPNPTNLPTELCAQIIMALYDYQPNIHDAQSLITWLAVMEEAFVHLYGLNEKLCISHLPKLFGAVVPCWLSDKKEVVAAVTKMLKSVLVSCVQPSASSFGEMVTKATSVSTPAHKIFQTLENALKYQYHAVWGEVLQVLAVTFDVLGQHCHSIMTKCLQSLSDLRESHHFAFTAEVDRALGNAIKSMGPQIVLKAIPIQFGDFKDCKDFPRSWLLPIIRDNVQKTRLGFFIEFFLPAAQEIRKQMDIMEKEGRMVEAKTLNVLQLQIWSTLPGFCTEPTDLKQSFKSIAKTLGMVLNEQPDLRPHVLSSLRVLINRNQDNETNKAELARFAKNYLPILFNLYTSEPKEKHEEEVRLTVFETVKVYLQITDSQLCNSFMERAMNKLISSEIKTFERHAVMDITRVLLPYITQENIQGLYNFCEPLLNNHDRTVQKKAYRIIEELCKSDAGNCKQFVQSNLPAFQKLLLTTLSSSSPPSKAPRLRALCHIVCQLSEENKDFVMSVIPEAILCTKETAEKPRMAAFNLIVEIGRAFQRWNQDKQSGIKEYVNILLAGLAGTTHLASASILALSKVLHDFKSDIPSSLVSMLIENILALLKSKNREIIQSAMFFVKMLLAIMKTEDLAQHLEYLVTSVCNMPEEHYRHFRFKAKEMFVKLVRKFGYETVSKMVPESHQKVLKNIRKVEARKARQKVEKIADVEEDLGAQPKTKAEGIEDVLEELEDDLMEIEEKDSTKGLDKKVARKAESAAWIEEQGDEIVDFLDPSVAQKVRATNPFKTKEETAKKDLGFKMTKDGKLIIEEEEDDKKKKKKDKDGKIIPELEDQLSGIEISSKKRKSADDTDDEDDFDATSFNKYQAGGSGIHRPVKKKKSESLAIGEEYKAKKAGGDIKRKGKPDPYSYIPLDRKFLNRRKRNKLAGQFQGIVKAAKKGARKGAKAKQSRRR